MLKSFIRFITITLLIAFVGCQQTAAPEDATTSPQVELPSEPVVELPATSVKSLSAAEIFSRPDYLAFCYGGYRKKTREAQPTIAEIKEDLKILSAMNVRIVRTYNSQQFKFAANLLEAIKQLKQDDPEFEMYVMLGAWINCQGAWSDDRNHEVGEETNNRTEVDAAVKLANQYPDIVKVIAVGNEAMIHWAAMYFVHPRVILKWVNHLQELKAKGELSTDVWITSSDNYESWGGGSKDYFNDDLAALIKAVDYVSLHTYPFHETHYDPEFWVVPDSQADLSKLEQADRAVQRAVARAKSQYQSTANYVRSVAAEKPIHIGETGWASICSSHYGANGSQAADEYKMKLFYDGIRDWTKENKIACFYFEAFDECWKDQGNESGSENHFGMINLKGQAKYALWDQVDTGAFANLKRGGSPITKTFGGDASALETAVLSLPYERDLGILVIKTVNENRKAGQPVTEKTYVVANNSLVPDGTNDMTYPSAPVKLNTWEGTCTLEMSKDGLLHIESGNSPDGWWGCGLQIQSDSGEDFSQLKEGKMHFEIKGSTAVKFDAGFQTGNYVRGDQTDNYISFGKDQEYQLTEEWKSYAIPMTELIKHANLKDVTGLFYLRGASGDGKPLEVRNIYFTR